MTINPISIQIPIAGEIVLPVMGRISEGVILGLTRTQVNAEESLRSLPRVLYGGNFMPACGRQAEEEGLEAGAARKGSKAGFVPIHGSQG